MTTLNPNCPTCGCYQCICTHYPPLPTQAPTTIDWGFTDLSVQVPKSVEHARLMILVAENYLERHEKVL